MVDPDHIADYERWEYKSTKQLSDGMLNAYGRDGWELVQIENGFAFFKRRLIDGLDYGPGPGDVDDSPEYHAARSDGSKWVTDLPEPGGPIVPTPDYGNALNDG